jgi:hypothetical protein
MQQLKDTDTLAYLEGSFAHDADPADTAPDADQGASRIPGFGLDFDLVPPHRRRKFVFFKKPSRNGTR